MSRNVLCAGVVVADHLSTPIARCPRAGELVMADELVLALGGCASNAAINLAKLGAKVAICGRVGGDVFGEFVSATLLRHGVDVGALAVDPQRATSQTLIVNVRGEDRRFVHSFGANAGLTVADLRRSYKAAPPTVVYLGGYLILPGIVPEELGAFFAECRSEGTLVVVDVATPGPADYLAQLAPVLPHVDVFLPNSDEAELILSESDPVRQAEAFRELGARRVVITEGERGAVAISEGLRARLGAFPVACVDATGGGDAFDAGYVAGLLEGRDELGCLALASAMGASCVRAIGTTAGTFDRDEAKAFLEAHELPVTLI